MTTHSTRGFVLAGFDEPAALTTIVVPELTGDQVLVDVHASSVNAFDWKVAAGMLRNAFEYDFPVTIGRDYAGVVAAVGPDVERVHPGDRVFGYLCGQRLHRGAFAEQLWVDEGECFVALPDGVGFDVAACLPLSGVVALRCVRAVCPSTPGTKPGVVVVVGAPGGVGTIAVQLAAAAGAEVVATGGADDVDYLTSLGATTVVEPGEGLHDRIRALHPDGVDGWIDLVSYRPQLVAFLDLLKEGGRVASVHRSVDEADLEPRGLTGANITSAPDRSLLEELGTLAVAGEIVVPVQQTFSLDDVGEALDTARTTHTRGKSVIVMSA